MLRRSEITMTDAELQQLLDQHRVLTCATIGPSGRPHLMPLWYVARNGDLWCWTYGKSQKVRNLERLPHATLQIEAGYDRYDQLRGAMLECDVEVIRDRERILATGLALARRYGGIPDGAELPAQARARVERQSAKRVVLRFHPTRVVTWDHRKLAGAY